MLDLIIILIIVFFTALFVISEISILTAARAKLQKMASAGNLGAKQAINLLSIPNQFLSSVQVGIALMGLLLGMYGGSSLSTTITDFINSLRFAFAITYIIPYADIIGDILALIVITYVTVIGEIVPKRIAMLYPEKIASYTAHFMRVFAYILYPFIWFLTVSVKSLLKVLGVREKGSEVSIDEVKFVINQAELSGSLQKSEKTMLQRLININTMHIGAIMTPRNKVVCLDLKDRIEVNLDKMRNNDFIHFPVVRGGLDNIIGFLPARSLLNKFIDNKVIERVASAYEPLFVPEVAKVINLINLFVDNKTRIAYVVDEYGNIEGIISFNDIAKIFLGDTAVSSGERQANIIKLSANEYSIAGNALLSDVKELLSITSLPDEEEANYGTLANFILSQLESLPQQHDSFIISSWRFKVEKMDALRVDRVLVTKI